MNAIHGLGLPKSPAVRSGAIHPILLVIAALTSTSASAQALELHAKFAACESCGCQTSQPLDVRLVPGRVFVKVHIEGWTPTNHTGYPAWVTYQARRRNNADWSGWSESLGGVSEHRIEWIRGKSTPEKPKPGDIVLFESEYQVNAPVEARFQISSQRYYDGSGACNQAASEHWLVVSSNPSALPTRSTGPSPDPEPSAAQVGGQWQEVDGDCKGTTWQIVQSGAKVSSLSAAIICGNGYRASWAGENIQWSSPKVLRYTVRLSSGAVESHVTTFTAPGEATVEVFRAGQQQKVATVHLRKAAATSASATPTVAGTWREVDGACQGTTWRIDQEGDRVTAIAAQITCNNGYRASWNADGIRWQSPGVLAYAIKLSSGVVERHVTAFTSSQTATVEVYPSGQQTKSATVHLRKQ